MDHGFALITEERKANGLFLKGDITFNTTIANMNHYKSGIALSNDKMVRATADEIKALADEGIFLHYDSIKRVFEE